MEKSKFNALDWIAVILLIIGGINWGLVGLLNFDLVATIFGFAPVIAQIVYVLVGLSAIYGIYMLIAKNASKEKEETPASSEVPTQ